MPWHIDEFIIFRSTVFARGWSSVQPIELWMGDERVRADIVAEERTDLVPIYGDAARDWGFGLQSFVTGEALHRSASMAFGGERVTVDSFAEAADAAANQALQRFLTRMVASGARVLEVGARARSGLTRRHLFDGCQYVGVDVLAGPNVDVVADAHWLTTQFSSEFDGVFSVSTFEHLMMPWKVATEINGVLKAGGWVFTQTHQTWPIHDAPWDFFRFSRDAWRGLFNEATGFRIIAAEHAEAAVSTPLRQRTDNDATVLDRELGYLRSICLAEKISSPMVTYSMPQELYDRIAGAAPSYPG
jgi:methyltransferase family protein